MPAGLRLVIYDRTCGLRPGSGLPLLTQSWQLGVTLNRIRGAVDDARGVTTWGEALDWLVERAHEQPIAEVQYWGHGKWGCAYVDSERLDASALKEGHPHHARLQALRERMGPEGAWWFRTCETFGADAGHDFAQRWSEFFGGPTLGHTFIIGPWQSGLHVLGPHDEPGWSMTEGLAQGDPENPTRALWSSPTAPRTINCLQGKIPSTFG